MPDQKQNPNTKQDQNKNAQPSFPGAERKDAGGIDDVQEGQEEGQEQGQRPVEKEEDDTRQAGGARQSEGDKPDSFGKDFGAGRKS
jgi:hypothetical protein